MNIKNLSEQINSRVRKVIRLFGMESNEYNLLKRSIKAYIPDALLKEGKKGQITVTRANKAQRAIDKSPAKYQDLFNKAKQSMDALNITERANMYIPLGGKRITNVNNLTPSEREHIRDAAKMEYEMDKNKDKYYADFAKLEGTDEYYEMLNTLQARRGTHGAEADKLWDDFVEQVKQAQEKKGEEIEEEYDSPEAREFARFLGL